MGCCFCLQRRKLLVICGLQTSSGCEADEEKEHTPMMLPVPQKSSVAPSETGRFRVALPRGRSLMDWILLTSSRKTAPKIKSGVDHIELSKHASVDDCWILLGDKVYDVTEYLSFHPGGVDELMRGAGTDATDLFNEFHAWVNFDSMLKMCLVGTFNGDRTKLCNSKPAIRGEQFSSGEEVNFDRAEVRVEADSDGQLRLSSAKWHELRDENISLEFVGKFLRLLLHFSSGTSNSLQWTNIPITIFSEPFRISINDGTLSLQCRKDITDVNIVQHWTSGRYHASPVTEYRNCEISEMHDLTHNTRLFVLRMPSFCRLMVPVGHHVMLRICINGSHIERPYTPVLQSEDGQFISFYIKFYINGIFTARLRDKKCGDSVEISDPLGCFDAWSDCAETVLMLAAGTGLAPMLRLAAVRLKSNKMTTILIFNKKTEDIIPDESFTKCNIPLKHPSLKIIHCLSEPEPEWHGEEGLISKELLSKYVNESAGQEGYRIFVCGPDRFVELTAKLLDVLEIPKKSVHIFQG